MRTAIQFLVGMAIGTLGITFLMGVVVGMVFRGCTPAPGARRGAEWTGYGLRTDGTYGLGKKPN